MARSPLTLAALATAAVPGLDVTHASRLSSARSRDIDAAVLTSRDGRHLVIRVPRTEPAEAEQSADLVALRALSDGVRSRLPFAVPRLVGQTPVGGTRAIVHEFVDGDPVALESITPGLASSIGRAIAAVHALPTSVVSDVGLPQLRAIDVMRESLATLDRASETGLVPAGLLRRWELASEDQSLWQFTPTVINGGVSAGSFLSIGETVTGVLGWSRLQIADPARDLFWLLGSADAAVPESAFEAYHEARGIHDRELSRRAVFAAELEVARWLLHGTTSGSSEIVDDAVEMLHALLDRVHRDMTNPLTMEQDRPATLTEAHDLAELGAPEAARLSPASLSPASPASAGSAGSVGSGGSSASPGSNGSAATPPTPPTPRD
ncbi:phosphotransferase [Microcella alkalica]|uniref:Aminoglycoside phosphotransferase (APT) family kinase protein n=1 Tax=Microcella alkalica TaxID=355930 RepID=A0A839E8J9_9MICO|nr:phosphotransferase [Microcella alkalica]MBA8847807.1 aminoglycoside phosphotransferase (APT) family kinase protein [Microcella alkalica]